ncbi:MAG TPA: hypothetical protein VGD68_12660, partial [Streptosporangiaceae bacterium]
MPPLTYPGVPPGRPAVLVTDREVLGLQPRGDTPLGTWLVRAGGTGTRAAGSSGPLDRLLDRPLDQVLGENGGSPVARRVPVLAVGSNACPAQIRRKLAEAAVAVQVPITAVRVTGLAVGVSAHVSRAGYLPATPVADPAAESELWMVWPDRATLTALDATEPNYRRVRLPSRYPARLSAGQLVTGGWLYVSRHGHLLNAAGGSRRLTDQATLIASLLAEVPALRALAGTTPQQWIDRTRSPGVRNAIRERFDQAGLVQRPGAR